MFCTAWPWFVHILPLTFSHFWTFRINGGNSRVFMALDVSIKTSPLSFTLSFFYLQSCRSSCVVFFYNYGICFNSSAWSTIWQGFPTVKSLLAGCLLGKFGCCHLFPVQLISQVHAFPATEKGGPCSVDAKQSLWLLPVPSFKHSLPYSCPVEDAMRWRPRDAEKRLLFQNHLTGLNRPRWEVGFKPLGTWPIVTMKGSSLGAIGSWVTWNPKPKLLLPEVCNN